MHGFRTGIALLCVGIEECGRALQVQHWRKRFQVHQKPFELENVERVKQAVQRSTHGSALKQAAALPLSERSV
ncbi:hypothetical protein Trydic_g6624 [Trypoxylus dichotomus]